MSRSPQDMTTNRPTDMAGAVTPNAKRSGMPTNIDRYQVNEVIGEGAMGIVYRVHDARFSCDRALKILREELLDDKDVLARFREEGRSAVRASGEVSHPNIVTVYDVGVFEGRPYIVMELFKGIPLDSLIEGGKTFTIEQILNIGVQLSSALASAHHHGVVHRDIKPANILLNEEHNLAKLTDFSVARVKSDVDHSLTHTGVVIGAPRYMPPEQALGQEVDGRSDLYGLGVVLYELLTGEKAYKSDNFTSLLIEIAQENPKPVRAINKSIPPGVERIISKLLSKKPERRFQDGQTLQAALKREITNLHASKLRTQRGIPTELVGAALLGLLVMALMGLTGYWLRNQQVDAFQKQTATVGASYADALSRQFSLDYARSGEDAGLLYQIQFSENAKNNNFEYQHIVLNNKKVLASTSEEMAGQYYEPPVQIRQISDLDDDTQIALVNMEDGREALQIAEPIEIGPADQKKTIGTLYVGLSTKRIDDIGRLIASLMALMSVFVSLLIALVSYFLIRRFALPLQRLRDGLNELASGDYDIRMDAVEKGLIGQTFEAFNTAAASLTVQKDDAEQQGAGRFSQVQAPIPEFSRAPMTPKATDVVTSGGQYQPLRQTSQKPQAGKSVQKINEPKTASVKKTEVKKPSVEKPSVEKPSVEKPTASSPKPSQPKAQPKLSKPKAQPKPSQPKPTKPKAKPANKARAAKKASNKKISPTQTKTVKETGATRSAKSKTNKPAPKKLTKAKAEAKKATSKTPQKSAKQVLSDKTNIPIKDTKSVPVDATTRIFIPDDD